jgi:hypothetical protein
VIDPARSNLKAVPLVLHGFFLVEKDNPLSVYLAAR